MALLNASRESGLLFAYDQGRRDARNGLPPRALSFKAGAERELYVLGFMGVR